MKAAVSWVAQCTTLFIGVGYLSNLVTRPWCERDLMQAAVQDMSGGQPMPVPVYVLPESAVRSENALRRLGVSTVRCTLPEKGTTLFNCFPWAGVVSSITIPYVVVVRWEYVAFPTSGQGRITTFFCVFGLRATVSERSMWVS